MTSISANSELRSPCRIIRVAQHRVFMVDTREHEADRAAVSIVRGVQVSVSLHVIVDACQT
jgi:hypothetical protein